MRVRAGSYPAGAEPSARSCARSACGTRTASVLSHWRSAAEASATTRSTDPTEMSVSPASAARSSAWMLLAPMLGQSSLRRPAGPPVEVVSPAAPTVAIPGTAAEEGAQEGVRCDSELFAILALWIPDDAA